MQLWTLLCACLACCLAVLWRQIDLASLIAGLLAGLLVASLPILGDGVRKLCTLDLLGKDREAYSALEHLVLNLKIETSWLNMGCWRVRPAALSACLRVMAKQDTEDFPTACRSACLGSRCEGRADCKQPLP